MMSYAWQQFVVAIIVAVCFAHLAWRAWLVVAGRRRGCDSGCGQCASPPPVVSVDALRSSAKR